MLNCDDNNVIDQVAELVFGECSSSHSGTVESVTDPSDEVFFSDYNSDDYLDPDSDDESINSNDSECVDEVEIDEDTELFLHRPIKLVNKDQHNVPPYYTLIIDNREKRYSDCDCNRFGLVNCMKETKL